MQGDGGATRLSSDAGTVRSWLYARANGLRRRVACGLGDFGERVEAGVNRMRWFTDTCVGVDGVASTALVAAGRLGVVADVAGKRGGSGGGTLWMADWRSICATFSAVGASVGAASVFAACSTPRSPCALSLIHI